MKKILLMLFFVLGCMGMSEADAQTYVFRGVSAAYKYVHNGRWTDWTDWKKVNVIIRMDITNDVISIDADNPQRYVIYEYDGEFTDDSGGHQLQYSVIDQDYDKGIIRLRTETNGNKQIYVQFADVILVWNVIRIS